MALLAVVVNVLVLALATNYANAGEEDYQIHECTVRMEDCVITGYSCVLGSGGCNSEKCNISCG